MIEFIVEGSAAPQGSKRHVGNGRMIESSKALPAWRKRATEAAKKAMGHNPPIDAPVTVIAAFYLPKPATTKFRDYPAGPPDLDKLQRAIGDALEQSGLLANDSRIVEWHPKKLWATDQPYTHIIIKPISPTKE